MGVNNVCESGQWDDAQLNGLGLLGLTPCFEDTILLSPIYVCLFIGGLWRTLQCRSGKSFDLGRNRNMIVLIKFLCCLANIVANIVFLAVAKNPADYEYLVCPLGILGWSGFAFMYLYSLKQFNIIGQWIPRLLNLWVFVCTCIRWPSQEALGNISGQEYYFQIYLVTFVTQGLSVALFYFEISVTREEFGDDGSSLALITTISNYVDMHAMSFRRPAGTEDSVGAGHSSKYTSIKTSEETAIMRPVSWDEKNRNPEGEANFISRLLFLWIGPLFNYAHKHTIEDEDVWDLRVKLRCGYNCQNFESVWQEERQKPSSDLYFKSPLLRTLIKLFLPNMLTAAPLLLLQNVTQLFLPFLIGSLIQFMDSSQPLYVGYVYSGCLFVGLIVMTISENLYFDICTKCGVQLRAGIIPMIYRHAMRMTSEARQDRSVGAISNHMSSDTEKIQLFCLSVNSLWSAPVRLGLGLYLLISSLGVAGIFGLIAVGILIPVQAKVMNLFAGTIREVMKKSDVRIKILNEVLGGMRVIKYYAWEKPFESKIKTLRAEELKQLSRAQFFRALNLFFVNLNPVALSVGTFIAFAAIRGSINPAQAFQALALFNLLVWPMMHFPRTVSDLLEVLVAIDRIEGYLLSSTISDVKYSKDLEKVQLDEYGFPVDVDKSSAFLRIADGRPNVSIKDASFSWGASAAPLLTDINLTIQPGEFIAIVGTTGSGKSSLVNAIIGEMKLLLGKAKLCGSVAYVPQQAWIFNATVKTNIVFGLPFDSKRYDDAINASSLRVDIESQFEAGDQTEIGEKGINLSGGQRQRCSIARAVYSNADIYVMDDPLSALDAHVTADVFNNCFKTCLSDKTRILVANQLHLMRGVDRIVVMKNGKIAEIGTFDELMATDGEFRRLQMESGENNSSEKPKSEAPVVEKPNAILVEKKVKKTKNLKSEVASDTRKTQKEDAGKLVQKEGHTVGYVKPTVYTGYFNAIGPIAFWSMIITCVISVGMSLFTSVWLGIWAEQGAGENRSVFFYISIYVALSIVTVFFLYISTAIGFSGAVNASAVMHADFVHSLMRAPISFFDSTPLGRITNRLTKDMNQVDTSIMFNFQMFLRAVVGLLGTLVILGINTTYVLVPFIPLLAIFAGIQNFYRSTNVQLKRLEAVSRSPVYAHFGESLGGISTIRAFLAQSRMSLENSIKLDENQRIYILSMTSNRWLSIRLEFVGGLLILATAVNCVILRNSLSPSAAGIALAYSLQITAQLNLLVRISTEMEGSFNSVERVQEYSRIESEAALEGPEYPPTDWPSSGKVEMKNLVVSYRKGLEPVLKGLNVSIEPLQKIGVCGRTGAGKSSLFQALFRMMEASEGSVEFDGINIAKFGLESVRNAISIIPQEPVLFSGSLRFNLDPFEQYTDGDIWNALERASLREMLLKRGEGLDMKVSEGGENFSVGQRQLVCLARALLRKSKILVLDEATANVDVETDALIQKTIRDYFSDRTTLTIAHRLNTIIDCDKILVLELGKVKEFDTPKALMSDSNSEFYSMVEETGPDNASYLKAIALDDSKLKLQTDTETLATLAKQKLIEGDSLSYSGKMGPLMLAVEAAAFLFKEGWEHRRSAEWENELKKHDGNIHDWLEYMTELLYKVNDAADVALSEEHFSEADSFGHRIKDMLSVHATPVVDVHHS